TSPLCDYKCKLDYLNKTDTLENVTKEFTPLELKERRKNFAIKVINETNKDTLSEIAEINTKFNILCNKKYKYNEDDRQFGDCDDELKKIFEIQNAGNNKRDDSEIIKYVKNECLTNSPETEKERYGIECARKLSILGSYIGNFEWPEFLYNCPKSNTIGNSLKTGSIPYNEADLEKIILGKNCITHGNKCNINNTNTVKGDFHPNKDRETSFDHFKKEVTINGCLNKPYHLLAGKDEIITKSDTREDIFKWFIGINDEICIADIDSGSTMCTISEKLMNKLRININPPTTIKRTKGCCGPLHEVLGSVEIEIIMHDIKFPPFTFHVIEHKTENYACTLGEDFFDHFGLILDPFSLSISKQISDGVYWSLYCNPLTNHCRRRLHNIPVKAGENIKLKKNDKCFIYPFDIDMGEIKLLTEKKCICENKFPRNNLDILFESEFTCKINNIRNENNEVDKKSMNDNINKSIVVEDVLMEINKPNVIFTIGKLENDILIKKGYHLGKLTTPINPAIDNMSLIKLNKNSNKYDDRLKDSLNLANLKIKSTGNSTIISTNISHPEINMLNKLQYDNKPLEPWEEGFEELDLPKETEWSYESLSARLKIESVNDEIIEATKKLLFKYKDVFSQTEFSAPCKLEPMNIDLTTDVPIYVKQYPMGKEIENALYDIVMEMQKAGTVVKSNSKYNFPVLAVRKRDQKKAPTEGEKFKLTRSPMGHKSTPGYFQRNMNFALGDLLKPMVMEVDRIDNKGNKYTENVSATRTLVYLDDILASAESELVLLRVTELILARLQKYGLKLKIDKCTFSTKKLNFLGHVIDGKNVSKSSEYVDKIMQIPEPKTGKELLQFLGLCAWISKYTYNWTQIAYELIQYQKNDKLSMAAKLVWTDAMSECFKNIKTALKADVKLAYPLPEEESGKLHLYCDASTVSAASFLG
ncbi:unnamed protein product, partial [Rotaria magnacalcarata]